VDLSSRLWAYIRTNKRFQKIRVRECDSKPLQQIPDVLLNELHLEVFMPVLAKHPFFRVVGKITPPMINSVCHKAMSHAVVLSDSDLFQKGANADMMSFVVAGLFDYVVTEREHARSLSVFILHAAGMPAGFEEVVDTGGQPVSEGQWVAEAALWTKWRHCGWLVAANPSELFQLHVQSFHTIAAGSGPVYLGVRRYQAYFAGHLLDVGVGAPGGITDIFWDHDVLEDFCRRALPPSIAPEKFFKQEAGVISSLMGHWDQMYQTKALVLRTDDDDQGSTEFKGNESSEASNFTRA